MASVSDALINDLYGNEKSQKLIGIFTNFK